jgi:hypothetical protein
VGGEGRALTHSRVRIRVLHGPGLRPPQIIRPKTMPGIQAECPSGHLTDCEAGRWHATSKVEEGDTSPRGTVTVGRRPPQRAETVGARAEKSSGHRGHGEQEKKCSGPDGHAEKKALAECRGREWRADSDGSRLPRSARIVELSPAGKRAGPSSPAEGLVLPGFSIEATGWGKGVIKPEASRLQG